MDNKEQVKELIEKTRYAKCESSDCRGKACLDCITDQINALYNPPVSGELVDEVNLFIAERFNICCDKCPKIKECRDEQVTCSSVEEIYFTDVAKELITLIQSQVREETLREVETALSDYADEYVNFNDHFDSGRFLSDLRAGKLEK